MRGNLPEEHQRFVKNRLAENRHYWTGIYCTDYLFHVCNQHPFLGIFFSHPMHPFNKLERIILETMRCFGTVAWLVILRDSITEEHWLRHQDAEAHPVHDHVQIFLYATVPLGIIRAGLQWLALQSGKPDGILERLLGHDCTKCVQVIVTGSCCLLIYVLVAYSTTLISGPQEYAAFGRDPEDLMDFEEAAWVSIFQSWVIWFAIDWIIPTRAKCPPQLGFYRRWQAEGREMEDRALKSLNSIASSSEGEDEESTGFGWYESCVIS